MTKFLSRVRDVLQSTDRGGFHKAMLDVWIIPLGAGSQQVR
jgi:hypothetical protein